MALTNTRPYITEVFHSPSDFSNGIKIIDKITWAMFAWSLVNQQVGTVVQLSRSFNEAEQHSHLIVRATRVSVTTIGTLDLTTFSWLAGL